jgi:hypothetical protein
LNLRRSAAATSILAMSVFACHRAERPATSARAGMVSCYKADRSIIYPLGDTSRQVKGPLGAWLTLSPDLIISSSANRRATAVDALGNAQEGAWWRIGDTIAIKTHDVFTTNDLRLVRRDTLLVGIGRGSTDHYTGDSVQDNPSWTAILRQTSCDSSQRR